MTATTRTRWDLTALAALGPLPSADQGRRIVELLKLPAPAVHTSAGLLRATVDATGEALWAVELGRRLAGALSDHPDPARVHGAAICDWLQRHPLDENHPAATLALRRSIARDMRPTPRTETRP